MTVVAVVAFVGLGLAGVSSLVRVVRPGNLADRVVALDVLLLVVVAGLALHAAWRQTDVFLDALVVAALLGFLGTVMVARFIEERGG